MGMNSAEKQTRLLFDFPGVVTGEKVGDGAVAVRARAGGKRVLERRPLDAAEDAETLGECRPAQPGEDLRQRRPRGLLVVPRQALGFGAAVELDYERIEPIEHQRPRAVLAED